MDFVFGGFASCLATVFTNPLEVVKTRMQLQGELAARGQHIEPYKNVFHAFMTVAKHDGITGLQKGLSSSLSFQFVLNAVRLGAYSKAVDFGWTKTSSGTESLWKNGFWGGIGGIGGCALASPFLMVKTHLQSKAASSIAVGHQHEHTSMVRALAVIYRANGIAGLYRGVMVTIPRGFLGSGGQLATFGFVRDYLTRHEIAVGNPMMNTFISGCLAGTVMAITIQPPDVIATRLYNQNVDTSGKGTLYNGVIDCFWKILRTEGLRGLYKGFWAQYFRIGPHAALVLFFFTEIKRYLEPKEM